MVTLITGKTNWILHYICDCNYCVIAKDYISFISDNSLRGYDKSTLSSIVFVLTLLSSFENAVLSFHYHFLLVVEAFLSWKPMSLIAFLKSLLCLIVSVRINSSIIHIFSYFCHPWWVKWFLSSWVKWTEYYVIRVSVKICGCNDSAAKHRILRLICVR